MTDGQCAFCSRAPGETAQQQQVARQQYAPAKAASHTGQPGSPGAPENSPLGQQPEQASAGQPDSGPSKDAQPVTGTPADKQGKQPAGNPGTGQAVGLGGQAYYFGHQGIPEQFWGYPAGPAGGAGPAYPTVQNPYP